MYRMRYVVDDPAQIALTWTRLLRKDRGRVPITAESPNLNSEKPECSRRGVRGGDTVDANRDGALSFFYRILAREPPGE